MCFPQIYNAVHMPIDVIEKLRLGFIFFVHLAILSDCKSDCSIDMSTEPSMYSRENTFVHESNTITIHVESNAMDNVSHLMIAPVFEESNYVRFVLIFLQGTRYPCTKTTVICIANEMKKLTMLNVL